MASISSEDLYQAIDLCDIEGALYETGILLKKDGIDILLETWVQSLACTAQKMMTEEEIHVFRVCLEDVWHALSEEHLKVKQCFAVTTQLCLFARRLMHVRFEPMHLSKFKKNVQKLFPEKAQLSEKGMEVYKRLLPPNTHDTYALAVRIAAGFTRMLDEKTWLEARMALEYLSRRHLEVKNTFAFVHESDEILWYIWGVMRFYYGQTVIQKCWDVFYWNYQNKRKAERVGLLWALPWYVCAIKSGNMRREDVWDAEEQDILEKVRIKTPELWKQLDETLQEQEDTSDDVLTSYIPRNTHENVVVLPPYEEQKKQIKLGSSRTEKTHKEKPSERSSRDETDRAYTWDRGIHLSRSHKNT